MYHLLHLSPTLNSAEYAQVGVQTSIRTEKRIFMHLSQPLQTPLIFWQLHSHSHPLPRFQTKLYNKTSVQQILSVQHDKYQLHC